MRATDLIYRNCGEGDIDFLNHAFPLDTYAIVMNPPYALAIPFILKTLSLTKQKIAVLLPLSCIESKERFDKIYSKFPPRTIICLCEQNLNQERR